MLGRQLADDDHPGDPEAFVDLGADDRRRPDGTGWMVMRDPEGTEFCVERGARER